MGSCCGQFGLADRGMTQLFPLPSCRLVRFARDGPAALTSKAITTCLSFPNLAADLMPDGH